jgi:hypothetical protein
MHAYPALISIRPSPLFILGLNNNKEEIDLKSSAATLSSNGERNRVASVNLISDLHMAAFTNG